MKQALISPNEPVETGYRVVEVDDFSFPVAPPLFWFECADDTQAADSWYDPTDDTIKQITPPEPPPVDATEIVY